MFRSIVIVILIAIVFIVVLPFVLLLFGANIFPPSKMVTSQKAMQSASPSKQLGVLIRSEDWGVTWHNAARSENPAIAFPTRIYLLAMHPRDPDVFYLGGAASGIFKSINRGQTWNQLADPNNVLDGTADVYDIKIVNANPEVMYAAIYEKTHGRIVMSDDGGAHFRDIYATSKERTPVFGIVVDPADSAHLLAVTGEGALIETRNTGKTWRIKKLFSKPVMRLIANPDTINELYAINGDGDVLKSVTAGSDWSDPIGKPSQGGAAPFEGYPPIVFDIFGSADRGLRTVFLLDPGNPSRLYLGLNKTLMRSEDGGLTWKELNLLFSKDLLPVNAVAVDPHNASNIFVAASQELQKSIDDGASWSNIPLPPNISITRLIISLRNSNLMFAVVGR